MFLAIIQWNIKVYLQFRDTKLQANKKMIIVCSLQRTTVVYPFLLQAASFKIM